MPDKHLAPFRRGEVAAAVLSSAARRNQADAGEGSYTTFRYRPQMNHHSSDPPIRFLHGNSLGILVAVPERAGQTRKRDPEWEANEPAGSLDRSHQCGGI